MPIHIIFIFVIWTCLYIFQSTVCIAFTTVCTCITVSYMCVFLCTQAVGIIELYTGHSDTGGMLSPDLICPYCVQEPGRRITRWLNTVNKDNPARIYTNRDAHYYTRTTRKQQPKRDVIGANKLLTIPEVWRCRDLCTIVMSVKRYGIGHDWYLPICPNLAGTTCDVIMYLKAVYRTQDALYDVCKSTILQQRCDMLLFTASIAVSQTSCRKPHNLTYDTIYSPGG